MPDAMLSFKLGPVQPFIEAARTLRDLWSGSYLLSWLTAHGMKPIIEKYGYDAFITPHVTEGNPLVHAVMSKTPTKDEAATLACLPEKFTAVVPVAAAADLKSAVETGVRAEWRKIAEAVRKALSVDREVGERVRPHLDSANWSAQIETHFEIVVVVRPVSGTDSEAQEWRELTELREMARSVRHVPAYSPKGDEKGRFPVKCSQLGSYEQMGPADFDKAKEYWTGLTRTGNKAGQHWEGLHGTGLQSSDKLCAVALVKRFMWPAYFAKTEPPLVGRLGVPVRKLRFTDTATMAAKNWLHEGEPLDPLQVWEDEGHWSGQWLHWTTRDQDDDAKCPDAVWKIIDAKRRAQGKPPTYFALMHLDGDNMGKLFAGVRSDIIGTTTTLTKFAAGVQDIVKGQKGELIYAGGDDVLTFLPTETVIECARQLRAAFEAALPKATLSGGIAVVHYKEDLRFALGQVRDAEKKAKRIARPGGDTKVKDALALTICKRSGEHSTVVMGWPEAEKLQPLIAAFVAKASDRWAYKLREEVDKLTEPRDRANAAWDDKKGMLMSLGRAETLRLVRRGENVSDRFISVIEKLFDAYQSQMQHKDRNWPDADVLTGFVALCQSASFLARGKE